MYLGGAFRRGGGLSTSKKGLENLGMGGRVPPRGDVGVLRGGGVVGVLF